MIASLSQYDINSGLGWSWISRDDVIVVDRDIIKFESDVLSSFWSQ